MNLTKDTIKRHLISLAITFFATFLLVVSGAVMSPDFDFTKDAILGIIAGGLVAGARAIAKVIYEVVYDIAQTK